MTDERAWRISPEILAPAALLALVVAILLPVSPLVRPVPLRDAGIYLYTGQQILDGALPYREVWDNRPPVIFYLNALGLLLGGGSAWGVWAVELVFQSASALVAYFMLRRAFGAVPAFLAAAACMHGVSMMSESNQTEDYALPFQFAALFLFVLAEERGRYGWYGVAIGAFAGVAGNIRQNLIGVWVGISLFLGARAVFTRRFDRLAEALVPIALGLLGVVAFIVVAFGLMGVLPDLWQGGFAYNFIYSNTSFAKRLETLKMGVEILARPGILYFALAGWIAGLVSLWAAYRQQKPFSPLVGLALASLPVDIALSSMSGRLYPHYFISSLPAVTVLSAYFLSTLLAGIKAVIAANGYRTAANLWLLALLLPMTLLPAQQYFQNLAYADIADNDLRSRVVRFVRENTRETDPVLMWGAEAAINFSSNRWMGTRYTNLYPLFMPGYHDRALIQAFVDEIAASRPALIFDSSGTNRLMPPLDAAARARWLSDKRQNINPRPEWDDFEVTPDMDIIFGYIDANYTRIGNIGSWIVYRRNDFQLTGTS